MTEQSDAARWSELSAVHEDIAAPPVLLPDQVSRIDGRPREASRQARSLAEALAFEDGWNRITDARRRLDDLAA